MWFVCNKKPEFTLVGDMMKKDINSVFGAPSEDTDRRRVPIVNCV